MLAFREVKFLGHQVTSQGIKISFKKVKVIQNIVPPKNKQSLHFGTSTIFLKICTKLQ